MQGLRELRLKTGRSLSEISAQIKDLTGEFVDPSTLSKVERGLAGLPDSKKRAIARFYGVTVGSLFFDEDDEGSSGSEDAT